jgi:levansucrase
MCIKSNKPAISLLGALFCAAAAGFSQTAAADTYLTGVFQTIPEDSQTDATEDYTTGGDSQADATEDDATGGDSQTDSGTGIEIQPSPFQDYATAVWTRAAAEQVELNESNTAPYISADFPIMSDEVWVWDTWPLVNENGKTMDVNGWKVSFALVAPRHEIGFPFRHWVARIGYFYSRNGSDWTYGGHLFPDGASFGSREWAGSTLLKDGKVYSYYTASGHDNGGYNDSDFLQRIAMSTGEIHTDKNGVWFTGFDEHKIILEPDGKYYQSFEQSNGSPIIYAFRDPFVFKDPNDGKMYMLFEGNTGGVAGSVTCGPRELGDVPADYQVPAGANLFTGNIGIAAGGDSMEQFELQAPLLSANCVNQQTERPHLVFRANKYYLFTISHMFTYAPGLQGPDGLYGFVGDSLRSDYQPLNGSGLVMGNPADQPFQAYSAYVMPNGKVESFIDTIFTQEGAKFGGTLAPTVGLAIHGDSTAVKAVNDYGFMP